MDIDVQLSPFGEYPQTSEDGVEIKQICDADAFRRIVDQFRPGEIPVDYDHAIESDDGSTRAAAWITRLWIDDDDGLMGTLALTPSGEEAIKGREYRYLSPAWILGADGRPDRLMSVALTNRPNLPVSPVINSASRRATTTIALNISASGDTGGKQNNQPTIDTTMDQIKTLLGLDAAADDAAVLAAVQSLLDTIEEMKKEKQEAEIAAEAEALANESGCTPEEKQAIINAYKLSPDATKLLVANMRAARKTVINSAAARTPDLPRKHIDARAEMAALPPSERKEYFRAHRTDF